MAIRRPKGTSLPARVTHPRGAAPRWNREPDMRARTLVVAAGLVLLALAAPSLVGLGHLGPAGGAQAHACVSNVEPVEQYACCPFNAHHAADPAAHARGCL